MFEVPVNVVCEEGFVPTYAHDGDAGADIRAAIPEPVTIQPGSSEWVGTGVKTDGLSEGSRRASASGSKDFRTTGPSSRGRAAMLRSARTVHATKQLGTAWRCQSCGGYLSAWMRAQEPGRGLVPVIDEEEWQMMISDDERREVASKLRAEAESWRCYRGEDNAFCMNDYEFTEAVLEDFGFDDADMPAYEVFDKMADLIDRPTCRMEECTIDNGSRSWGMRCTACGNEFEHVKPGFGWSYCPNCGAEVLND